MGVRATGLFEEVFLTVDNDSTVVKLAKVECPIEAVVPQHGHLIKQTGIQLLCLLSRVQLQLCNNRRRCLIRCLEELQVE
jgi:hypothetical protein